MWNNHVTTGRPSDCQLRLFCEMPVLYACVLSGSRRSAVWTVQPTSLPLLLMLQRGRWVHSASTSHLSSASASARAVSQPTVCATTARVRYLQRGCIAAERTRFTEAMEIARSGAVAKLLASFFISPLYYIHFISPIHGSENTHKHTHIHTLLLYIPKPTTYHHYLYIYLSLIHIWRCRRSTLCRSRWSPYH